MAAGSITIELTGALALRPATACNAGTQGTNGPVFNLALRSDTSAAAAEISQVVDTIASPLAFVALPFPAALRARLLYVRSHDQASFDLRVTYETTGAVTIPFRGTVLLETKSDDRISGVELQGSGSFEWLAAGDLV